MTDHALLDLSEKLSMDGSIQSERSPMTNISFGKDLKGGNLRSHNSNWLTAALGCSNS